MKKVKILFFCILSSLTALSFFGENNFGLNFSNNNEPTITQSQVHELVNKELIKPLMDAYIKANPDAMMMKCAPYMRFEFGRQFGIALDKKAKFYENQNIEGNIILDDCGQIKHVCALQINFSKKDKILVQESFFTGFVDAKSYVKSFCEKISKNEATY